MVYLGSLQNDVLKMSCGTMVRWAERRREFVFERWRLPCSSQWPERICVDYKVDVDAQTFHHTNRR